jgi:hypothetical protein
LRVLQNSAKAIRRYPMIKIEAIVREEKLEDVKSALKDRKSVV